ncbi:MAG: sigma-70 family RNA polymerase sigma factor [Gemmataceae bacterium]|nr:sigma-70 family RNA polymerase sigma factor [Gemmataceae bacterium]
MSEQPPSRPQAAVLYHFCRMRLPRVPLPLPRFAERLALAHSLYLKQPPRPEPFLEALHVLDWFLASACLDNLSTAWEALFRSRASRTDALLIDALRQRASRLFPRDEERQEEAVLEFWGFLLAGQKEGTPAILARYDGLRPLVPWLIRVFHNRHLSEMRRSKGEVALPEAEDTGEADLYEPQRSDARWHEQFRDAAREWLAGLKEEEILLLGLRLRYRLSQREVAKVVGIHEGNVTRRMDALSKKCHEQIEKHLTELGWTGDDLQGFIQAEMASLLLDDPRLAVRRLASLLAARGKSLPDPRPDEA